MPFSLSFSGGGCRGAAHIGVLLALHEAALYPCAVSGTSAGAIAAGFYAAGYSAEALLLLCQKLKKNGEKLIDVDILGILKFAKNIALRQSIGISGLLKGEKFRKMLAQLLGELKISDIPLPLCIAAVDLSTGETVSFSQKRPHSPLKSTRWQSDILLRDAIYSSCCLPTVFTPQKLFADSLIVDGGVADNLPVDLLHAISAPNIIAVDISQDYTPICSDNLFEIAHHSLSVMSNRLEECYVRGERLLIKPKLPEKAGVFTFSLIEDCIEAGYAAAKELIPIIRVLNE